MREVVEDDEGSGEILRIENQAQLVEAVRSLVELAAVVLERELEGDGLDILDENLRQVFVGLDNPLRISRNRDNVGLRGFASKASGVHIPDLLNQDGYGGGVGSGFEALGLDARRAELGVELETMLQRVAEHEELETRFGAVVSLDLELVDLWIISRGENIRGQTLTRTGRRDRGGDRLKIFCLLLLGRLKGGSLISDQLLRLQLSSLSGRFLVR